MNLKYLIVLSVIVTVFSNNCESLVFNNNCDFYITCLEDQYTCGPNGYPVGYGHKYCSKFVQYLPLFAQNGKSWVMKTLVCLKKHLFPLTQIRSTTCPEIHRVAFDSHPGCYVESGFCELFLDATNLKKNIHALLNVYEVKDFASAIALKQVFQTAGMCGVSYVAKITEVIKEIFTQSVSQRDWEKFMNDNYDIFGNQ